MLELTKIKIDGTQSRAAVNEQTVTDYCEAINNGVTFPPVIVFKDGNDYWLADGFHRFLAHSRAGKTGIYEEIRIGTKRDAILYSAGANHEHGLRRTNADKRSAVMLVLSDADWSGWSNEKIAKQCHVSANFVGDCRKSISNPIRDRSMDIPTLAGNEPLTSQENTVRTFERNGKTYQQNTANIGRKPEPAQETGRTAGDVMREVLAPQKQPERAPEPRYTEAAEVVPEEYRLIPMTYTEELEQQIRELGDNLEDLSKAFNDLTNSDKDGYVSEITKLRRNLEAVTLSRDSLQNELNDAKRHIKYLEKKLKA
jgi:hypothetical protein